MCKIPGAVCGILEFAIWLSLTTVMVVFVNFKHFDYVSTYWASFTVMTMIWELAYIIDHTSTIELAKQLIETKTHICCSKYSIAMILPWKLSKVFYAEYGAWADREYQLKKDPWSKIIEGSHAFLCGLFCVVAFVLNVSNKVEKSELALVTGMGCQLMNSLLYMGEYYIQSQDKESVNFRYGWPCGRFYIKRYFMYINLFWTIMPLYVIIRFIVCE